MSKASSDQTTSQAQVARYYSRPGSWLGYNLLLGHSQHFGYYDDTHTTEPQAQINYHQRFIELLDLKDEMTVLDAGCGQGVVATYLTQRYGVHVTGITVVPREVKSATARARKVGVSESTRFVIADYAQSQLPPASFDRIYTTETLSHAVSVAVVLEEFYSLLKPGGKLICAEYETQVAKLDDATRQGLEFTRIHAGMHGVYQFEVGRFEQALTRAKFTDINSVDWTHQVAPSFQRLARLAHPLKRIVARLA